MNLNNENWIPVPEMITPPSYVEYMENYEKYRSPLSNMLTQLNNGLRYFS